MAELKTKKRKRGLIGSFFWALFITLLWLVVVYVLWTIFDYVFAEVDLNRNPRYLIIIFALIFIWRFIDERKYQSKLLKKQ